MPDKQFNIDTLCIRWDVGRDDYVIIEPHTGDIVQTLRECWCYIVKTPITMIRAVSTSGWWYTGQIVDNNAVVYIFQQRRSKRQTGTSSPYRRGETL